ncbi:MAG: signal peptidase II [Acutalibacteraceae bacterium]|jgi:signal peptidase II
MLWFVLAAGALLVGLDQLTKWWAITALTEKPVVLIDGVLELRYSENTGAAWGIFSGARWPLIVLTVALLGVVIWVLLSRRFRSYRLANIAACLIMGGGIGNLIDRIFRGYVVDFIYVKLIDFPIFNVADCGVVIGAALMLIFLVFIYRDNEGGAANGTKNLGGPA